MHRLTDTQLEILANIHLNGEVAPDQLARQLRISARAVRYHLATLKARGLTTKAPFINIYPLGYRYVNLYFSIASSGSGIANRIAETFKNSDHVSWLAELGGDFHLGSSLCVRNPEEVPSIIEKLSEKLGNFYFEKSVVLHTSLSVYPPKMLTPKALRLGSIGYQHSLQRADVDALDISILNHMSNSRETSGRAIARALGRPHTTVEARIARLRQSGIIAGYWYPFDISQLGYQTFKLLLFARGFNTTASNNLGRFCERHSNISYLIRCIGSWDFEVGVDVENGSQISTITQEIYDLFGDYLTTIKVVPMFRVLKWNQLPITLKSTLS